MARSIQQQLLDAYEASGLTWDQLLALTSLRCGVDSLARKLRAQQSLRTYEAEAIANALRIRITAGRRAAA